LHAWAAKRAEESDERELLGREKEFIWACVSLKKEGQRGTFKPSRM
jgi:hypothetical protein